MIIGGTGEDKIYSVAGNSSGFFKFEICTKEEKNNNSYPISTSKQIGNISSEIGNVYVVAEYANPTTGASNKVRGLVGNAKNIQMGTACLLERASYGNLGN